MTKSEWFVNHAIPGLTLPTRASLDAQMQREQNVWTGGQPPAAGDTAGAEGLQRALDAMFGEYAAVSDSADRRSAAAMTASGFALALTGLLFTSHAIARSALAAFGVVAISGFGCALWSQLLWITKTPGVRLGREELHESREVWVQKELFFVLSVAFATTSLAGCTVALVLAAL